MWEKLKALAQHPAAQAVKKFCGDPVQLYSVFLVTTAMYYYHEKWAWLYMLITLAVSFVLMRFYDFVAKKRVLGPACYLVFRVVGLYLTYMIIHYGEQSYPVSYLVWFLTPQGAIDFSLIYTIATYLLMTGFITSAVYYFSKTCYRMVMQLIIMLIPLSLYAKEGRQMPALLVILLLASYFLLMVYCRQLRETGEVRHITGFHNGASIAVFVAAFSIVAAIVPKPQFEADREFIDNAMAYTTWSDILMNAISMFTDSTDNRTGTSNNARTLYYVQAEEPLRLRTQTYSYYLPNDSWNVIYEYDKPDLPYAEPLTYQPRALMEAILDAAEKDADFAETYGLAELAGKKLPAEEQQEMFYISALAVPGGLSPTRTESCENAKYGATISANKVIMVPQRFGTGSNYDTVYYYSDTYANNESVYALLTHLQHDTYAALLQDAAKVLETDDPDAAALLREVYDEAQEADRQLADVVTYDYHSAAVEQLAKQLTEGLTSDIEKARAIESYFAEEAYVYDLSYKKEDNENVDDFLNTTHRGVCYEYATAMTLLCRSAGLPTRFVQGYNMSEPYDYTFRETEQGDISTNYVVKMRNAHAFPEVYIAGYGWLSFEPTVAADEDDGTRQNGVATQWGYLLLILAVLALGFWACLPYLREQQFRRALQKQTAAQDASAIFIRMRQILHLSDSATVRELQDACAPYFSAEEFFSAMDALLYNPTEQPDMTAPQLAETYIRWQAQRKAYEKEQKKLRKEQKKAHVNV